jgi:hypothetical protein
MNRSLRAALTGALLLMLAGATLAEDRVLFHNRTTKKDDEVRGKIEEETPGGIKIKDKRTKQTRMVPAADIQQVIYDALDVVTFRTPDGKQNAARRAATAKARAALLTTALEGYADLEKKLVGHPNARRYIRFRIAETTALQAQDNPAQAETAIKLLAEFKKDAPGGWEILPALKILAKLQEDAGKVDDARKSYEELAEVPDVPRELKQESEILVGRLLLRVGRFADAEKRLEKLDASMSAGDAQRPFVKAYLAESRIGQNKLAGVEKQLTEVIRGNNDPRVRGTAYNLLGDYYRKTGKQASAFWSYLRVDAMYNEDPEEHAKALYYLSSLFDKEKKDPIRGKECSDRLKGKRFAGTVYQKLLK